MLDLTPRPEKALLVGVGLKSDADGLMQTNLEELAQLTESAGAIVVGITSQRLTKIVPSTFIGSGKVQEIARLKDETGAHVIIIDTKLSGVQQRNLQTLIGCKVLDRSQLILDIFAQRAQTREGKLQVELAQLKDQLPRLIGEAIAGLSRQAGGIGTRGPGETKLEMDRRKIKTRIEHLEKDLEHVRNTRELHRNRRRTSQILEVALVGYTNAGKSTLLNRLTKSDVYTEDKLFATLDPTTRKLRLPSGRTAVLTDTVGFINNLPHNLIEAFKATFEEITNCDLILHVHDGSHSDEQMHSKVVADLLKEVNTNHRPVIHVYNKIDQTPDVEGRMAHRESPFVNASAITGEGVDQILALIDSTFEKLSEPVDLYLPTGDPSLIYSLARDGKILSQEMGEHITHCRVQLSKEALQRWSKFLEE